MIDSTAPRNVRLNRVLWSGGISLLLLVTGCKSSSTALKNPSISVDVDRSSAGVMQGLTVTGKGFTPNAQAHVTAILAASGSNAAPYVEDDVTADAGGKIRYEQHPLKCPEPMDYGRGSWVSISVRDTTSGIADTKTLTPGNQPDCGS